VIDQREFEQLRTRVERLEARYHVDEKSDASGAELDRLMKYTTSLEARILDLATAVDAKQRSIANLEAQLQTALGAENHVSCIAENNKLRAANAHLEQVFQDMRVTEAARIERINDLESQVKVSNILRKQYRDALADVLLEKFPPEEKKP
jgi:NAD-dependent DNA ligase